MERNYIRTSAGIASFAGKLLAADDLRLAIREVIAQEEAKRRKLEEVSMTHSSSSPPLTSRKTFPIMVKKL